MQTQIRLQYLSDKGLHCLPFFLHILNGLLQFGTKLFHFMTTAVIILTVHNVLNFIFIIHWCANFSERYIYV